LPAAHDGKRGQRQSGSRPGLHGTFPITSVGRSARLCRRRSRETGARASSCARGT
jgi:hypothetical protein